MTPLKLYERFHNSMIITLPFRHLRQPKTAKISYHGMVNISDMTCHPDYDHTNFHHDDVGILRLSTPVALSSQLVPACLANSLSDNLEDAMLQTMIKSYWDRKYIALSLTSAGHNSHNLFYSQLKRTSSPGRNRPMTISVRRTSATRWSKNQISWTPARHVWSTLAWKRTHSAAVLCRA